MIKNKPVEIKQQKIETQLEVLHCDSYRITLMPRNMSLKPRVWGNLSAKQRMKTGKEERFWTAREVIELAGSLEKENMKGYDIYMTPISAALHHFVVDDLTKNTLNALKQAGYKPALVQESSEEDGEINYQAILIVEKHEGKNEQSIANLLVVEINIEYGDKNFTGVVHPFRLAGFSNKKPGKNDFFTTVIEASGDMCEKTNVELMNRRATYIHVEKNISNSSNVESEIEVETIDITNLKAVDAFRIHWRIEEDKAIKNGWNIDRSKLDWRVVKNLKGMGFSSDSIASAMFLASPNIQERHPRILQYISDTVRRA